MSDSLTQTQIKPLGAGDLVDRTIRFYRKTFLTFIFIAAPPVLVGAVLSIILTFSARYFFNFNTYDDPVNQAGYYFYIGLGGIAIWITELVGTMIVMGGASRNFVRHILFGDAISFKSTYGNVRERFFSLAAASGVITFILSIVFVIIFYLTLLIITVCVMLITAVLYQIPYLVAVLGIIAGIGISYGSLWLFFLVASRFAFVPQILLVEGQSLGSALARSVSLGGLNVNRFISLFLFTICATYSALILLYVPISWIAWMNGYEIFSFEPSDIPWWLGIVYQMLGQISFILISPVWMIGLCLLYVDERVRSEGYDIELMAARRLGEIPAVPVNYSNPLQPALSVGAPKFSRREPPVTSLKLDGK